MELQGPHSSDDEQPSHQAAAELWEESSIDDAEFFDTISEPDSLPHLIPVSDEELGNV